MMPTEALDAARPPVTRRDPSSVTAPVVHALKTAASGYGWLYWLLFCLGMAYTASLALRSTGAVIDDEIAHYLISRSSWTYPEILLSQWGRPVRTLVYALPALGGLTVARLFSVALAAATVLVTTRIALRLGLKHAAFVPLFLWFQPWYANLSHSLLPQVPFALWLALATYLGLVGRNLSAAVFFGLLPLTRHEGIAVTGLWLLYLAHRRDWKSVALTCVPLLLFNISYLTVLGQPAFNIFFTPRPTTFYGSGDWLHFVRPLRYDVGAPVLCFAAVGLAVAARQRATLVALWAYAAYFVTHTLIYRFGLFASGGYSLFLLPVAPAFAVLAALGAERGWSATAAWLDRGGWPWLIAGRAVATSWLAVAALVTVAYGLGEQPVRLSPQAGVFRDAAAWIRASGRATRPVISTHPWFSYFHGAPLRPRRSPSYSAQDLLEAPEGALVVWDHRYSDRFGLKYADVADPGGPWRRVASFGDSSVAVMVFERQPAHRAQDLHQGRAEP